MFSNLRSLIFKLDPETAHTLAVKSLKFNFVPNILDQDKNNPLFKTELFNQNLDNPIGIAAGFDKNAEVYNSLFRLGFGFVEVGTVTPLKQLGNPKPRVFRLVEDEALINRLGFNNLGANNVFDRIKANKKKGLLGINIGPNKDSVNRLEDYLACLRIFHTVADYITINISSRSNYNLDNVNSKVDFQSSDEIKQSGSDGNLSFDISSNSSFTLSNSLDYSNTLKSINSQDALEALRLSVGLSTTSGAQDAFSYIAADINKDGRVSAEDALLILKYSSTIDLNSYCIFESNNEKSTFLRSEGTPKSIKF